MNARGKTLRALAMSVVLIVALFVGFTVQAGVSAASSYYDVKVEQAKINYREVKITVPEADYLYNHEKADSVKVTIKKTYIYGEDKIADKVETTMALSKMVRKKYFTVEVEDFGKQFVTVQFYKDGKVVNEIEDIKVGVVAEEYNIASINATYPVTLFTLQLWDITEKDDGTPVPTIVNLYRAEHWNWDELPENVYAQPNLTDEQTRTRIQYATKYRRMADYIGELVELNPDAKFNLYINDGYYKLILQLLCANGIPEENYNVVLLSDGSGSYDRYCKTFAVENPQAKYDEMAEAWEKAKTYCYENHEMDLDILPYNDYFTYDYVITNEDENVEWWVGRFNSADNLFVTPSEEFNTAFFSCTRIKAANMNTFLQKIKDKGEAAESEFKTLFHFSDAMFTQAEQENKTAMVFLGTRLTSDQEMNHFASYAKFAVAYYGDEYVYYYKGHPATPTSQYPEREALLEKLGITDIESSIAAELIFFFNPEVHLSGFASTTFQSVDDDQIGGYFHMSEASGLANADTQYHKGEFYMTYLGLGSEISDDSLYKGLCKEAEHKYYLAEFGSGYDDSFDFAIWDDNESTITYYKDANGTPEFVSSRDAMLDQEITADDVRGLVGNAFSLNASARTALAYQSSNEKVAAVDENGKVTLVGEGTCQIRITAASSIFYKESVKEVTVTVLPKVGSVQLSYAKKTYTGSSIEAPVLTVKATNGKALVRGTDYTVSGLSAKKAVGRYAVTVTFQGDYSGTRTLYYTIVPKAPASVTAKLYGYNDAKVSWEKATGATGYLVYYKKSNGDYKRLKTTTDTSARLKNMTDGVKYTFKVVPYYMSGDTSYVSLKSKTSSVYALKKLSKPTVKKSGSRVKVSWKNIDGETGYQISKAIKKNGTNIVATYKTATGTYKKLSAKQGKAYYYKVRAYRVVDGKKIYGPWSTAVKFKR